MTRLRRICFSVLLDATSLLYIATCGPGLLKGATASGGIEIIGRKIHSREHQTDLSDVVVWLEPTKPHPMQSGETPRARLLQKNKTFSPHILVIRTGTLVDFPNADPIFHSAFSNYNGQLFDLGLYAPGTSKTVLFRRPGIVRVFCNIHSTMSAVIIVLDTPYFTRAKGDGAYQIPDVPPGNYELHLFDERATQQPAKSINVALAAEEAQLQLPVLTISEEDYQTPQHKNKYGLDYPPDNTTDEYGGISK